MITSGQLLPSETSPTCSITRFASTVQLSFRAVSGNAKNAVTSVSAAGTSPMHSTVSSFGAVIVGSSLSLVQVSAPATMTKTLFSEAPVKSTSQFPGSRSMPSEKNRAAP